MWVFGVVALVVLGWWVFRVVLHVKGKRKGWVRVRGRVSEGKVLHVKRKETGEEKGSF